MFAISRLRLMVVLVHAHSPVQHKPKRNVCCGMTPFIGIRLVTSALISGSCRIWFIGCKQMPEFVAINHTRSSACPALTCVARSFACELSAAIMQPLDVLRRDRPRLVGLAVCVAGDDGLEQRRWSECRSLFPRREPHHCRQFLVAWLREIGHLVSIAEVLGSYQQVLQCAAYTNMQFPLVRVGYL